MVPLGNGGKGDCGRHRGVITAQLMRRPGIPSADCWGLGSRARGARPRRGREEPGGEELPGHFPLWPESPTSERWGAVTPVPLRPPLLQGQPRCPRAALQLGS